jgi:hypothetical protein
MSKRFDTARVPTLAAGLCWLAAGVTIVMGYNRLSPEHGARAAEGNSGAEATRILEQNARAHASEDEMPGLLGSSRAVVLGGGNAVKAVSRLRVGADGSWYVVDVFSNSVRQFSATGEYIRRIGGEKAGTQPGALLFPSDVDVGEKELLVSDFKQTRISRFSLRGDFVGSFSTAGERYSAKNVFSASGEVFVCGNRYATGLQTVHRYGGDGGFRNSMLTMPEPARKLNLDTFDDCLAATSPRETVLAFPYEYKVYRIANGQASALELARPTEFRGPARPLIFEGVKQDRYRLLFETWKAEWTPLENIALLPSDGLAIEYRTYNPLRYSVDLWDLKNERRVKTIHTNYRLLAADGDGRLFFEALSERSDNAHQIVSGILER